MLVNPAICLCVSVCVFVCLLVRVSRKDEGSSPGDVRDPAQSTA